MFRWYVEQFIGSIEEQFIITYITFNLLLRLLLRQHELRNFTPPPSIVTSQNFFSFDGFWLPFKPKTTFNYYQDAIHTYCWIWKRFLRNTMTRTKLLKRPIPQVLARVFFFSAYNLPEIPTFSLFQSSSIKRGVLRCLLGFLTIWDQKPCGGNYKCMRYAVLQIFVFCTFLYISSLHADI